MSAESLNIVKNGFSGSNNSYRSLIFLLLLSAQKVLSGVVFIITYFLLVCPCFSFKRKHPANIILLVILTIALSVTAGILATFYSTKIVVMAFGTTSAVVLIVTLLTFWSKFDITKVIFHLFCQKFE
jgi:FtsH-binding integral membrane protein